MGASLNGRGACGMRDGWGEAGTGARALVRAKFFLQYGIELTAGCS